jgi:hypothetical protein
MHFARSPVAENDSGPWAGAAGLEPARMALGQVPSVLLNECWTDLRTIAADGKGFDPDWEKKVQA